MIVWLYRIESFARKSIVSMYGSSNDRCSTRRLQQPTVSASSYASAPLHAPTSDFSFPTLSASLSIIQIAVAS